jgi:biopolymer transport protein ExbD
MDSHAEINVTPLIDVLLVLLVTLIVAVPIATHGVFLQLPSTHSAVATPIVRDIAIDYDGSVYVDRRPVADVGALERELVAMRAQQPVIRVSADRRAPYGVVAQVLAAAQRSRLDRLSLTPVPPR